MGLRDQLLKAGLVNKKQARKAEAEVRKEEHDTKKIKTVAETVEARKRDELAAIEAAAEAKREADRQLNLQRDALVAEREKTHRAWQILRSNARLPSSRARIPYFFVENGHQIRRLLVTEWERELLIRGKMAIARLKEEGDGYVCLPRPAALSILDALPGQVLVCEEELPDTVEIHLDHFDDLGVWQPGR